MTKRTETKKKKFIFIYIESLQSELSRSRNGPQNSQIFTLIEGSKRARRSNETQ